VSGAQPEHELGAASDSVLIDCGPGHPGSFRDASSCGCQNQWSSRSGVSASIGRPAQVAMPVDDVPVLIVDASGSVPTQRASPYSNRPVSAKTTVWADRSAEFPGSWKSYRHALHCRPVEPKLHQVTVSCASSSNSERYTCHKPPGCYISDRAGPRAERIDTDLGYLWEAPHVTDRSLYHLSRGLL